jgi:uncharacterized C2H2 Zn-finger protein
MIGEEEYVCPLCGLVLSSLTAFHRHVHGEHKETRQKPKQG